MKDQEEKVATSQMNVPKQDEEEIIIDKKFKTTIINNPFILSGKVIVSGISNPMIDIYGFIYYNDYKFIVKADDKEIEYNYDTSNHAFRLYASLPKNSKNIKIYVHVNKKDILIIDIKNTKLNRIKRKIYTYLDKLKPSFLDTKNYSGHIINPENQKEYLYWCKNTQKKIKPKKYDYEPLISVVIPVYNVSKKLLSECLDSILKQTYQNFEICLADDCSTNKETVNTLRKYERKDKRIKVVYREENGHISEASNSALEIAQGEFVAMMDNDDVIPQNALQEMVKVLNDNKEIDFIYTDEDKLDLEGKRCCPHFKPDYAPDTLLSLNYICHFTLLRTSILKSIGGWRKGFEGAQDYDLFLRFFEKTTKDKIYHIPKILYHWRMVEGSTSMTISNKDYATLRGKKAIEDALKRRKNDGIVHIDEETSYFYIEYKYKSEPKISIIIPTRDYADVTEQCLKSIYEKTTYKNYEVVIVNNNSEKKETFDLFDKYKKKYKNFKVVDANFEFNYSKINNLAVKETNSDYICLLNNDTEVITPNWLELMVGYAMQPHIGAVGAKLMYPDDTIQHCGVILGLGGVAGHAFTDLHRNALVFAGRTSVPSNFGGVTAACLMVDRKKYEEVNGLEENLKVAFNDVDFCIKLLEKGYYNVVMPKVELYHHESKSRGYDTSIEKQKRFASECDYMYKNWGNILLHDPFYNENFSRRNAFKVIIKK